MDLLITSHTLFGLVALAAGTGVLIRAKGDRLHRWAGWMYAGALALLCVESFWIRDTTPFFRGLGPFHVAALVSFATLLAGLVPAVLRMRNWFEWHYKSMAWSYIGLVMATGSHFMEPVLVFIYHTVGLPAWACYALAFGGLWGLPPIVGRRLLKVRGAQFVARFGTKVTPDPVDA